MTVESKIKSKVDFKTKYSCQLAFSTQILFIHSFCTFFYRIKKVSFLPFVYPLPPWSPLMKDGLETMPVLSGLGCECLVCLLQVPASAADPWALNQLHSPGNPHSLPHRRNGIKEYSLNVTLLRYPSFYWHLLLKMLIYKEEDLYIREQVIYRVTTRLHTAFQ